MSQDSAARLERRARTLLRAYPADYRRDRADELIGTLLEATPAGQSFPSARDARALIAGGVRARAARNRRLSTTANLRLAVLLGLSIALAFNVNFFLAEQEAGYSGFHWLAITAGALSVAAALAPWLGSRAVTTATVVSATALLVCEMLTEMRSTPLMVRSDKSCLTWMLLAMIALAALSGGPTRLPRSWLCLPCVPLAGLAGWGLLRFPSGRTSMTGFYLTEYAILLLLAVVACWFVTDARPAFGLAAAAVLTFLLWDLDVLSLMRLPTEDAVLLALLPLPVGLAIMAPLSWWLRRQAALRPRPLPEP